MERYAYCLCLHVRPGTIFIGVINLAESLLCGVLFLVALIYQTNLDTDTHPMYKNSMTTHTAHTRTASHSLAVVVYMASATVSAMLLYGVVKGRPSYLMPFFWIRLCDFFFSLPTFMATLYANPAYSASSHWNSESNGHHSFSHSSASSPPPGFTDMRKVWPAGSHGGAPSLLVATCVILFKGYFLCVVWKCYRYLKMREMIIPLQLSAYPTGHHHHRSHHHGLSGAAGPGLTDLVLPPGFIPPAGPMPTMVTVNLSPPDYETATKGGSGITSAPPDYETAIRSQQDMKNNSPPYEISQTNVSSVPSTSSSSSDIEANAGKIEGATAAPQSEITDRTGASLSNTSPIEATLSVPPSSVTVEASSVTVEASSVTVEETDKRN